MFILADGGSAFSCGKTDELRYEELTRIFKELEAEGKPIKGRIRDRIAEALNVSSAQVGKLDNIKHNAIPDVERAVKSGDMSISTANEVAKLAPEKQHEIITEKPKISPKEIKGNTAQLTANAFSTRLLAYFPPSCTIRPSKTYSLASSSLYNLTKNLTAQSYENNYAVLPKKIRRQELSAAEKQSSETVKEDEEEETDEDETDDKAKVEPPIVLSATEAKVLSRYMDDLLIMAVGEDFNVLYSLADRL